MSDYLDGIIDRSRGLATAIRPRLASAFERQPAEDWSWSAAEGQETGAPRDGAAASLTTGASRDFARAAPWEGAAASPATSAARSSTRAAPREWAAVRADTPSPAEPVRDTGNPIDDFSLDDRAAPGSHRVKNSAGAGLEPLDALLDASRPTTPDIQMKGASSDAEPARHGPPSAPTESSGQTTILRTEPHRGQVSESANSPPFRADTAIGGEASPQAAHSTADLSQPESRQLYSVEVAVDLAHSRRAVLQAEEGRDRAADSGQAAAPEAGAHVAPITRADSSSGVNVIDGHSTHVDERSATEVSPAELRNRSVEERKVSTPSRQGFDPLQPDGTTARQAETRSPTELDLEAEVFPLFVTKHQTAALTGKPLPAANAQRALPASQITTTALRPRETELEWDAETDPGTSGLPLTAQPAEPLQAQRPASLRARPVVTTARAGSYAAIESSPSETSSQAPAIHVTIGRIEVKAAPPAGVTSPTRRQPAKLGLDEYLRRRGGGTS
jgi:hypothetical protein